MDELRIRNPKRAGYSSKGLTEEKKQGFKPRAGCFSYTNVILSLIFVYMVVIGIVALAEGIKTKPAALDAMARFVGISDTVQMGRSLMENPDLLTMMDQLKQLYSKIPQDTIQEWMHKSSILVASFAEEDLIELKNNVVAFSRVLGSIEKEKVQALVEKIDVDKINELVEATGQIEKRLNELHEIGIKVQI